MSDRVAIRLLRDWLGKRSGVLLPIVPAGQARLMVKNGIAEYVDIERNPKRERRGSTKRSTNKKRSKKAS